MTKNISGISLRSALRLLLGDIDLTYLIKDEVMKITTKEKAAENMIIKVYPVGDLVMPLNSMGGGMMGGMGGGMGGGMMGGMGGGMGGMGGGMGGMGGGGMGGGFFNVGPEKVGKIKVTTVCLEHGKKEPNNRMVYQVVPIESFVKDANVVELCKMVGRREVPQNAAQAAVWHMANGLSWQELAAKDRVRHLDGSVEKYFSFTEMQLATRIMTEANRRGAENPIIAPTKDNSMSK